MVNQKILLSMMIMFLLGSFMFFLIGTGLFEIKGPASVTGMNFLNNAGADPNQGAIFMETDTAKIEISGVRNFKEDEAGVCWIDLNMRYTDTNSGRVLVENYNILGENGRTRIILREGVSPIIKSPMINLNPGTYLLEVDVIDRNDDGRIVATLGKTITVVAG